MFILGVTSLVLMVVGFIAGVFIMTTVSDGTGNETGMIAGMMLMFGAAPVFALGFLLMIAHTVISLLS